jgi:acyl carrier protein
MTEEASKALVRLIAKALRLSPEEVTDEMAQESTGNWNSMRHLMLVTQIENTFSISLTTQEVISLKRVVDIKRALRRHGINI